MYELLEVLNRHQMVLPPAFYEAMARATKNAIGNPVRSGTIAHVIEYHQLAQIAQRSGLPVGYLHDADLYTVQSHLLRAHNQQVEQVIIQGVDPSSTSSHPKYFEANRAEGARAFM